MNKIILPSKPQLRIPAVADLQDALQQCLDRGALLADDEAARQELAPVLQRERAQPIYGEILAGLTSGDGWNKSCR